MDFRLVVKANKNVSIVDGCPTCTIFFFNGKWTDKLGSNSYFHLNEKDINIGNVHKDTFTKYINLKRDTRTDADRL